MSIPLLAAPPKRNWIGSRKTDVTAHRQETCATTERRLRLRGLKGSTTLTYPRRGTHSQCARSLQPDKIRGRCSARASAQETTDCGKKVRHRADRVHHRTACDRAPRGRVQGARWGSARSEIGRASCRERV